MRRRRASSSTVLGGCCCGGLTRTLKPDRMGPSIFFSKRATEKTSEHSARGLVYQPTNLVITRGIC